MLFFVEIDQSCSGSKIFNEKSEAMEYYQFILIGLEYMNDCDTEVLLKESLDMETWKIVVARFSEGKPKRKSWLSLK